MGLFNLADVALPPSPLKPYELVPAMVVMTPGLVVAPAD
jgi:hypothetical protein